jgi:hypothetical protein
MPVRQTFKKDLGSQNTRNSGETDISSKMSGTGNMLVQLSDALQKLWTGASSCRQLQSNRTETKPTWCTRQVLSGCGSDADLYTYSTTGSLKINTPISTRHL